MALSRISGNQIATSTAAIIDTLSFLDSESILRLPAGNTNDRPTGISVGTIRFNTDLDSAEVYKADADGQGNPGWTSVGGGGASVGNDGLIRTNNSNLTENAAVGSSQGDEFKHGHCVGPITVDNSVVLTLESDGILIIH